MEENVEVYVVDDERNARVVSARNPPPQVVRQPPAQSRPVQAPMVYQQPTQARPVYAQPAYGQPYGYPAPRPQVVVVQSQRRPGFIDALSTIDVGQTIKTLGGVIASFKALPAPPTAAPPDHHDRVGQDLRNMMKYQAASFEHAKADERFRTLFNLLGDAATFFVKAAAR
jgi:hypothetical protein